MAVLLVSYDLNKPGQKHSALLKDIKEYPWARLSESSYAIKTSSTASTIYNSLKKHIDNSDNLYIINIKKPYDGFGSKDVINWLDSNLTT